MFGKNIYKDQKGIGLIEVLGAVAISVIVITALVSMSVFTLRSSLNSRLLLEGTKFANTEVELVRAYRDRADSWSEFYNLLTTSCTRDTSVPEDASVNPSCFIVEGSPLSLGVASDYSDPEQRKRAHPTLEPNSPEQVYISFNVANIDSNNLTLRIYVTAQWTGGSGGGMKSTSVYTDLSNWQE